MNTPLTKRIKKLGYSVKGFCERFNYSRHTVYGISGGHTGKRCIGTTLEIIQKVEQLEAEAAVGSC